MKLKYDCGIELEVPDDHENLYKILGVTSDADDAELKEAWLTSGGSLKERFAYKALRDPKYRALYSKTFSVRSIVEAGFFDDGLTVYSRDHPAWNPRFACTPVNKLVRNLKAAKNPIVLLTTGAFSPIHKGHVLMMEKAKEELEDKGFDVVAGYFAPGHDDYVGQKYNGTAKCNISDRIAMIHLATRNSDWLDVDPWAGQYMPAELVFSDVIDRLYEFIKTYVRDIPIAYVFGSDNSDFQHLFTDIAVCVQREGKTAHIVNENVLSTKNAVPSYSSSDVRNGNLDLVEASVAQYYQNMGSYEKSGSYLIRCDVNAAVKDFAGDQSLIQEAATAFELRLRTRTYESLKTTKTFLSVRLLNLDSQLEDARTVTKGEKTISIDAHFEGDHNIGLSRVFQINDMQESALRMINRPGTTHWDELVSHIEPGNYTLVEDDVSTGKTIAHVKSILPQGVNLSKIVLLTDFIESSDIVDIVDSRDYLVGCKDGGLVAELPNGKIARVPYMAPYVNLKTRASLASGSEKIFSLMLWQENVVFFSKFDFRIKDMDPSFAELAYYLGYQPLDKVVDFCKFHVEMLLNHVD